MSRKIISILPAGAVLASLLLVTLLKWVPVTCTPLMLKRELQSIGDDSRGVKRQWTDLEDLGVEIGYAVIAAEDQRFPFHKGFDYEEVNAMLKGRRYDGGSLRGCSTISQQTAKNCFTWCTDSWLRKGIEAWFTVLIEKIWGKRRILEVYLNVAEMGPGIFGVDAAAMHYFKVPASELSRADCSALACCLPNPFRRNPEWVCRNLAARRDDVALHTWNYQQMTCYVDIVEGLDL